MNNLQSAELYLRIAKEKIEKEEQKIDRMRKEQSALNKLKMKNKDIAEFLNVSETTVWRMLQDGRLKSRMMKHVMEVKNKQ